MKLTKYDDYEKKFRFPMYSNHTVHIVFAQNARDAAVKRWGEIKPTDCSALYASRDDHPGHGWLIFEFDLFGMTYPRASGIIAHESWHCVEDMLDYIGAKLDNEIVAYHIEHVVEQVAKFAMEVGNVIRSGTQETSKTGNRGRRAKLQTAKYVASEVRRNPYNLRRQRTKLAGGGRCTKR